MDFNIGFSLAKSEKGPETREGGVAQPHLRFLCLIPGSGEELSKGRAREKIKPRRTSLPFQMWCDRWSVRRSGAFPVPLDLSAPAARNLVARGGHETKRRNYYLSIRHRGPSLLHKTSPSAGFRPTYVLKRRNENPFVSLVLVQTHSDTHTHTTHTREKRKKNEKPRSSPSQTPKKKTLTEYASASSSFEKKI
jgi:hypothetical protein